MFDSHGIARAKQWVIGIQPPKLPVVQAYYQMTIASMLQTHDVRQDGLARRSDGGVLLNRSKPETRL